MKKIIPILTILTLPAILSACDNAQANTSFDDYSSNINTFQKNFAKCSTINDNNLNRLSMNKYKLSLATPNYDEMVETLPMDDERDPIIQPRSTSSASDNEVLDEQQPTTLPEEEQESSSDNKENVENEKISSLYNLTADIDAECDEFCSLKEKLSNAISETHALMQKVNNNEITLTNEQKMFLTEQSSQLKNLSKGLTRATTELGFCVNDINQMAENTDTNQLAIKYLIALENLAYGNQILENSLASINMLNCLMTSLPNNNSNNYGRILYGFKQKGQPPVIKDYSLDKDGNIIENTEETSNDNETDSSNKVEQNSLLCPNIDSYGNFNSNIDSFFNTALFNRYNMGRNGFGGFNPYYFGYPNMYPANNYNTNLNMQNPNIQQTAPSNHENSQADNNATAGVNANVNTQNIEHRKKPKIIRLAKNIDTYKTADTLTPKQRFLQIKNSVSNFLGRFKRDDKEVENPIYQMQTDKQNDSNELNK